MKAKHPSLPLSPKIWYKRRPLYIEFQPPFRATHRHPWRSRMDTLLPDTTDTPHQELLHPNNTLRPSWLPQLHTPTRTRGSHQNLNHRGLSFTPCLKTLLLVLAWKSLPWAPPGGKWCLQILQLLIRLACNDSYSQIRLPVWYPQWIGCTKPTWASRWNSIQHWVARSWRYIYLPRIHRSI
jgi:hypothetical protein